MMKIFVYGTLMSGLEREKALFGSKFLGSGYIIGSLYNLGQYPGLKQGHDKVFGEVYEINSETLENLDQIDGYCADQAENSLYIRKNISVSLGTGSCNAETYIYNLPVNESSRIVTGDYHDFISQIALK